MNNILATSSRYSPEPFLLPGAGDANAGPYSFAFLDVDVMSGPAFVARLKSKYEDFHMGGVDSPGDYS